jgi:hypothetical protein
MRAIKAKAIRRACSLEWERDRSLWKQFRGADLKPNFKRYVRAVKRVFNARRADRAQRAPGLSRGV